MNSSHLVLRSWCDRTALPALVVTLVAAMACSERPPSAAASPAQPTPASTKVSQPTATTPVASGGETTAPAAVTSEPAGGELAGVHYVERLLGGARPDEQLPLVVTLHPMGGDPLFFEELFARYPGKARLIIPHGYPSGGAYFWYFGNEHGTGARTAADRLAPFLAALTAARPTVGKPVVMGLSQGAIVAYALALAHPESASAIFPVSGVPPPTLGSPTQASVELPAIHAFHGAADPVFPVALAREAVATMRAAGFRADLREYANVAHMPDEAEERDLLSAMAAAVRR